MKKLLYLGEDTASFHLFFNGASAAAPFSIFNLTDFSGPVLSADDIEKISTADHIIFSRDIDWKTLKISAVIARHGIPYSYYADDNYFILLRILPSKAVDQFLINADTLITTTEPMETYLQSIVPKHADKHIRLPLDVDISAGPTLREELPQETLNIGFLGTGKNSLYEEVFSDLSANLSSTVALNIYAPASLCRLLRKQVISESITLIEFGFTKEYKEFVDMIKGFNLDFILQPADDSDPNYQYKNLNSLLLPYYCSCLTLFCDNPPYRSIGDYGMAGLLNPDNRFSQKIINLVNSNAERKALTKSLFSFVEANFSKHDNIKNLQDSLDKKLTISSGLSEDLGKLRFSKLEKIYHKLRRSIFRKSIRMGRPMVKAWPGLTNNTRNS